jgi:hypothetical protein
MFGSKINPTLTRPGDGLKQKTISRYCPFKVELEGEGRIRLVDDVFSRVCQALEKLRGKITVEMLSSVSIMRFVS